MSGALVFTWVILMTGVILVESRGLPARTLGEHISPEGSEREIAETEEKQAVDVFEIERSQAETLYGQLASSRRARQVQSGNADDMFGKWRPHFGELEENMMAYNGEESVSERTGLRKRGMQVADFWGSNHMDTLCGLNAKGELGYFLNESTEGKAGQWQPRLGELEDNLLSHKSKEQKSGEAEGPHQK